MVCKKEVIAWFCDLSVYRRIDFLCALMDCCSPIELRFLGTYVESLGRRDYDRLRESELHANDVSYLSKLTNITDIRILDKVLTSLALMNSRCTDGATVLYRTLKEHTDAILSNGFRTRNPHTETDEKVVLLAVMALNHPAFTFSQKQALRCQLYALLQAVEGKVSPEDEEMDHNQQGTTETVASKDVKEQLVSASNSSLEKGDDKTNNTQDSPQVHIKAIEVKGLQKRQSDKRLEYTFQVHWSDSSISCVSKTHAQLFDFQCKLIQLFPEEASSEQHQDRVIPYIPGKRIFSMTPPGEQGEKTQAEIVEYAKQLSALPQHILQCDHITHFFRGSPSEGSSGGAVVNSAHHRSLSPTVQQSDKPKPPLHQVPQQQLQQLPQQAVNQSELSKQMEQFPVSISKTQVFPGAVAQMQQPLQQHSVQQALPPQQQQPSIHLRHPQTQQFPSVHLQQQQQQMKGHLSPHPHLPPQHQHLHLHSHAHIQLQQQQVQQHHHHLPQQLLSPGNPQLQQQQQQQQMHPPPPSTLTHNLTASMNQLHISQHHHQVNMPSPGQAANGGGPNTEGPVPMGSTNSGGGGSNLSMPSNNNSMVTSTMTTTSAGSNSVYYQTVFIPSPQEQYTSAGTNAEPVSAALQSYKSAVTKVQPKPQSWPQSYTPPLNPHTHTAPLYASAASTAHVCISTLQQPIFRYPVPLNSPQAAAAAGMVPPNREMVAPIVHDWLKKQRLHKYANLFEGLTFEQVLQITDEQVDRWNIVKGAKGRIKTQLEQLRRNDLMGFNGLTPQSMGMHATGLPATHGFFMPPPPPGSPAGAVIPQLIPAHNVVLQHRQQGEGNSSECSSVPSSPRESSDENDRDSEESESSATSCSDAIQNQALRKDMPNHLQTQQQVSPRDQGATAKTPSRGQTSVTTLPYSQVVKAVGVDAGRQGDRPPHLQGGEAHMANTAAQGGGSSQVQPQPIGSDPQQPPPLQLQPSPLQQQRLNAMPPHPLAPSNTVVIGKHMPQVVSPDGSMQQLHQLDSPVVAAAAFTPHMFHVKQPNNKQSVHTVQYLPADGDGGGGFRASKLVVQQGVSRGSVASPSPPAIPAGTLQTRSDNLPLPVISQHGPPPEQLLTTKTIHNAASVQLVPNPAHSLSLPTTDGFIAPTSVTYVTGSTQSISVGIQSSNADSSAFNNNQQNYNSCISCGCNGQCGQSNHHTTTSAPNTSSGNSGGNGSNTSTHPMHFSHPTYIASPSPSPNQLNFPNFYHGANMMPPATPNSMLSPPPPNLPSSNPRFHPPMPPSLQGALADMMYTGNPQFGMMPPTAQMYLMSHRGHAMHSASAGGGGGGGSAGSGGGSGSKKGQLTCFNCGGQGHRASECREATMESITHNSHYRLNYKSNSSPPDVMENTDS
ncbi:uncharacterized protein [Diadema antillarum]|uniref:uncharacterized protein n=1 Tax=Diadema antillarum TaxID=105358 RepID=UPI003A86957A